MLRSTEPGGPERELNRLDIKNRQPLPLELEKAVIAQLEQLVPAVAAIVIADQVQERNCGVITDRVRTALARLAEAHPGKFFVADSRGRIGEFAGVMVKPNLHEAKAAVEVGRLEGWKIGQPSDADDPVAQAGAYGQALFARNQKPVFVTVGAQGIVVVTEAGVEHMPGILATGAIDVVGAGDSVMAGLVAGLGAGGSNKEAAILGNMAASITIQQLGTTGTASREQLRRRFAELKQLRDGNQ
jgi:bifunctional ADP-heptose synthase (sugar kinase/adenylyltransferase)